MLKMTQSPVSIILHGSCKYHYFKMLCHDFQELISPWPNIEVSFFSSLIILNKHKILHDQHNVTESHLNPIPMCIFSLEETANKEQTQVLVLHFTKNIKLTLVYFLNWLYGDVGIIFLSSKTFSYCIFTLTKGYFI